ncbi:hypothetical protein EWM64_g949 [Hericium alpestre]|uniref:Uncharacterized protein n=1 Tax=Hericium alpestre TaxID=135208 RepID=A0A4Z0A9N4_9AGAM|nr:hypothetical protein EWM64_g949 [Hericium alpestre]
MLGTRTKQVFSYGRRGNRIVNVSERCNTFNNENLSVKVPETQEPSTEPESSDREETPTPDTPPLRPVRRYRKRKIVSPTPTPSPSPKAVRAQKSSHPPQTPPSKPTSRAGRRLPLSTHSPNIPRSPFPAALKGKKISRVAVLKGTPLKQSAPPVVEFDVIVLDDKGRRVSQERRVSRTNVQVNPMRNASPKEMAAPDSDLANNIISVSDSEDEYVPPKRAKRRGTRAVPVIVSSEDEELLPPPRPSSSLTSTKPGAFASKTAPSAGARPLQHIPVLATISLSAIPDHRPARPIRPSHSQVEDVVPARPVRHSHSQIDVPAHPVHPHSQAKIVVPASPALKRFQHILARQPPVFSPPPPTRSKPHHLTPIRHGRPNFMRPPSPPSPTTPTDFDLSVDFAGLDISSSIGAKEHADPQPAHLLPLLTECGQDAPHDFSSFIKTFPYDPIVRSSEDVFDEPPRAEIAFQKIGEASYSEVFGIGDVVLKVIPIRDEGPKPTSNGFADAETPAPSDAKDILKEMVVTEAVGAVCGGFVKLLRTYVVRGKYPSLLLSLWDEYDERKGSESIRPSGLNLPYRLEYC